MLFNSYEFLLLFLPLAVLGYYLLGARASTKTARGWLVVMSLLFYAWANPAMLGLLLASIAFNFVCARAMTAALSRRGLLFVGIVANLGLLGYYKYANFFIANYNALLGTQANLLQLVFPLAISFYTIQQLAFLVDVYEGLAEEQSLLDYVLFVAFFPKLIAGPLVHHREMMPQFSLPAAYKFDEKQFTYALFVFAVGLFKKVMVADTLARYANTGFDSTHALHATDAWIATMAYLFQVYFDFSGYSDMAVGIGMMFNISLPLNFNSPYRATSIIVFWQRWHMTLTGMINEYVYMPLMRMRTTFSFSFSLLVTVIAMTLVGFWHGASWNYVLFGALNGCALVANHLWRRKQLTMPAALGWLLTMMWWLFVVIIFRSPTLDAAERVYRGMFCGNWTHASKEMSGSVSWLNVLPDPYFTMALGAMFVALFVFCVVGKNPHELKAQFSATPRYFFITLASLLLSLLFLNHVSEFIYFQF